MTTSIKPETVIVGSSALPAGAATAAKQDTGNTSLATLAGAVAGAEVQVDVLTLPAVTIAAAQTLATVTTVTTLTGGGVAHDAADSGNPHKIGAKAESSPKGVTLVADGDRTDLHADLDGILIVKSNTANADRISERVADTAGASAAFTNFSAVASTYNYVTAISISNSSAGAAYVDFRDGVGGSVLWTMYVPAGGGNNIACDSPLFRTSANTALAYDVSAATTTMYINVSGFQSKS